MTPDEARAKARQLVKDWLASSEALSENVMSDEAGALEDAIASALLKAVEEGARRESIECEQLARAACDGPIGATGITELQWMLRTASKIASAIASRRSSTPEKEGAADG